MNAMDYVRSIARIARERDARTSGARAIDGDDGARDRWRTRSNDHARDRVRRRGNDRAMECDARALGIIFYCANDVFISGVNVDAVAFRSFSRFIHSPVRFQNTRVDARSID